MTEPVTRLQVALVDRYRLDRELGQGGMATVYLADDLKHRRKVAIKVLRPELAAVIGAERFLREIDVMARLNHPHILGLHDSGETRANDGERPFLYYVMPFVDGESLRDRLRREQRLSIAEAVHVATEVADALGYAHAHDIVHRDVKPENILFQSGHAIVADFGIARALSVADTDRMTVAGLAVGTPTYMSPEQANGDRDLDGRSDLYSLGCVTYEMLTGEPPFTGPTIDSILVQRFTRPPPRVSAKLPQVPRHIDAAVHTAMAREPAERFATVALFAERLRPGATGSEPDPRDRSIAVLPFANMSAEQANDYFSDGIAEEIINALTQLPRLRVAARTSSFSFKGKTADLRAVGDQLNVSTVLQGSVRKAGGRLRVTVQLVDVAGGYHLWSERYDRELTDVFAVQDEIATAIARKLKVTLSAGEGLVRPPTDNLEAYALFLEGRALVRQRGPALLRGLESLEQAIRLDGDLAPAHAELAKALLLAALYGMGHPAQISGRALAASTKALALDPKLVAAQLTHGLLSLVSGFDRETAAAAWVRALALEPANLEARTMQAVFDFSYVRGEHDRAVRELSAVVEADPLNAQVRAQLSLALSWNGQAARAAEEARRAIELDPTAFYPQWTLLHAIAFGPDPAGAAAICPPILARFGRHPWVMMGLAWAHGAAGHQEAADALYAELVARARTEYVQPAALAVAAVGAGHRADALRYLGEAADIRDPLLALMALQWPGFPPALRADPKFVAVLHRWGWDRPMGSVTLETVAT
jgi:serine/threonine-protein kinase